MLGQSPLAVLTGEDKYFAKKVVTDYFISTIVPNLRQGSVFLYCSMAFLGTWRVMRERSRLPKASSAGGVSSE